MSQLTEAEKTVIRDAANAAIKKLHIGQTLTPEESKAIDTYFESDWHGEDFRELTPNEIEDMKARFRPGSLPWLDKLR